MAHTSFNRLKFDRRRATRSGRRDSDPMPCCPACGLTTVDGPHKSDAECIDALGTEIARITIMLLDEEDRATEAEDAFSQRARQRRG